MQTAFNTILLIILLLFCYFLYILCGQTYTSCCWKIPFSDFRKIRRTFFWRAECISEYAARKTDHISPLLRDLHWLRVPERVKFKLYVGVPVSSRHGTAVPRRRPIPHVCWWQPSADSPTLVVRPTRRSTLGDRAFPVAAAHAWNSLPPSVTDAPSLL